jgi:hypothetical protein
MNQLNSLSAARSVKVAYTEATARLRDWLVEWLSINRIALESFTNTARPIEYGSVPSFVPKPTVGKRITRAFFEAAEQLKQSYRNLCILHPELPSLNTLALWKLGNRTIGVVFDNLTTVFDGLEIPNNREGEELMVKEFNSYEGVVNGELNELIKQFDAAEVQRLVETDDRNENDPFARLFVNVETKSAGIDKMVCALKAPAAKLLAALVAAKGDWVTASEIVKRPSRVYKCLPNIFQELILTESGRGYRISRGKLSALPVQTN